jgi:hypothetical protein
MMRRSTVVVLILFALLGGLYWYTRQDGNIISAALAGTATPSPTLPGYLIEPFEKTITTLVIQKSDGARLTLNFVEGLWTAHNGEKFLEPVDQQAAEYATLAAQDLRILSEIDMQGTLADFGLDDGNASRMEVSFSDGTSLRIKLGKATITGSGYYALNEQLPEKILIINRLSLDNLLALPENPPIVETNVFESTPTPEQ